MNQPQTRQVQKLTIDDKQKFELQKEIFITIRLIDMVEKCAQLADDKITPEKHSQEITKLIERYKNFTSKIDKYDLNSFIKEYGLEDCKFGIDRINKGPPQIKQGNRIQLVVDIMQRFYLMQDIILENKDNPKTQIFKPIVDQLIMFLNRAKTELPPYKSYLEELQQFSKQHLENQIIGVIPEDEFQKFESIIDLAQQSFMTSHSQQ
ncbi:unnamed protein product (macronuclear) [Paramecium tetraurelia]|uniref:Vacuolar protein sorting-associated protein 28 homolog n=1 Tax=Paramecium tetraurelia TaxID=5888 RepID=A0C0T5_PARTE|nr:uncharacterized protein GSPATT00033878001 [Paramecium tetraurelia]CAK64402.1 unnamed protein product [Paramecium tetraurelia]|eukprot:XP_001431800.1 hypothetical protein (macronuclear) [Paramecium tetraurelia strain d4-2]